MLAIFIMAAAATGADSYSCTTPEGRRLSRDRLIEECAHVAQVARRANGSVERIPSEEERAAIEDEAVRAEAKRKLATRERLRNDNLLSRFPNEAAHSKHRTEELADAKIAIRSAKVRLTDLEAEREVIAKELEFYPPGHPAPQALLRRAENNGIFITGQKDKLAAREGDVIRINARLDFELAELQTLWAKTKPTARSSSPA